MYACSYQLLICTVDNHDENNSVVTIGAVVGAFCVLVITTVITNIMVWICCFRKRHHTGMYVATSNVTAFGKTCIIYI